ARPGVSARTFMIPTRLGPPPRATALLARRLRDSAWRDSILGDLDEEHAAITRRRSRFAADIFYWTQVWKMGTDPIFRSATRPKSGVRPHFPGTLMSELRLAFRNVIKFPAHTSIIV